MMQKKKYLKELVISGTQKNGGRNTGKEVEKIQSWLCLHERMRPGIATMTNIDSDFGSATETAVKNFQRANSLPESGEVDQQLFELMTNPVKVAFEGATKQISVRDTILEVAHQHLNQQPAELVINQQNNCGPWVRSYMEGVEGEYQYWCMGFVQSIIDQAFSLHNLNFKDMMPLTYSCDTVGMAGLNHGCLLRNNEIQSDQSLVLPGDILLCRNSWYDWTHTAIIIEISGDTFTTIEGNTNGNGSRNGDGVYKRVRNFRNSTLDVFSIKKWALALDFELRKIQIKSRGKVVEFLEEKLTELGYDVVISEYFGETTDAAVRDFQSKNGLEVDGIVGDKTWTALLS